MPFPPTVDLTQEVPEVGVTFAELQDTIARGLRYIMLRALGNSEDAHEAVQETLARAVEAIRRGKVPRGVALGAFVHGIARHVIADAYRQRVKSRKETRVDRLPLPSGQSDPLQRLISNEQRDRVRHAIAQLDPQDRQLLTEHFVNGLRLATIARRWSLPAETIRKRKSRALTRLRNVIRGAESHVPTDLPTSVA